MALVTLPGDLTTMGICLANITILALSGVPADCHGLTSDSCKRKLPYAKVHFLGCIAAPHQVTTLHDPEPTLCIVNTAQVQVQLQVQMDS